MLESMLSSFSESTSRAIFPSLQILKITMDHDERRYGPDYMCIEPLLLSIKAVSPPNLKTIMFNDKRI